MHGARDLGGLLTVLPTTTSQASMVSYFKDTMARYKILVIKLFTIFQVLSHYLLTSGAAVRNFGDNLIVF
jgi:hypothetical protein